MRTAVLVPALALLGTALTSGTALAAHVPGDFPTIQAALDAGATQIEVAPGAYPESLLVTHGVQLLRDTAGGGEPASLPRVAGMHIDIQWSYPLETRVHVKGFHFTGPVTEVDGARSTQTSLEECRLDAGYVRTGYGWGISDSLGIRSCLISGGVDALSYTARITDNTVVGGGIRVYSSGGEGVLIANNCISGAPNWGIEMWGCCTSHVASQNTVRDSRNGIASWEHGYFDHNLVEDCSGTAYRCSQRSDIADNVARRCGGHGVEAFGDAVVQRNVIDSVGLCGVRMEGGGYGVVQGNFIRRSEGHGIWAGFGTALVIGNLVLEAGGDGIRAETAADGNVVLRCSGAGIVATSASHNTSCLNDGAGLEVAVGEERTTPVTHNIAYGNSGSGLLWSGAGTPVLGCNDWFGNAGGMVAGTTPGATDLSLDPLFCDLAVDSVTLRADSPLLAAAGCGLIGARGQGCAAVPMRFSLVPGVLSLRSQGRWVAGCLQPPVGYSASDIDVGSIRVNGTVTADSLGPVNVADHDGDGVRDLEVKFDRAALAATLATGEAVEVTVQGMLAGRPFVGATVVRVQAGPRAAGADEDVRPEIAYTTSLQRVSPNPARGAVFVHLTLADSRPASLALYDVSGRLVASREVGGLGAGAHHVTLGRAGSLPPGLYLVRLKQGEGVWVRRVTVLD